MGLCEFTNSCTRTFSVVAATVTSLHFSPNEISQVANFYHIQILAPSLHQQLLVQNDAGPAVAAEAEARHSAIMNERNEHFREQYIRLQHVAISRASRLRLEFLQADAAREGRQTNIIDLQPSSVLQRLRITWQDDEQLERVQSTASTIRSKIINQQRQADPMQAHNLAKASSSVYTVEALQRNPNARLRPQRQGYVDVLGRHR